MTQTRLRDPQFVIAGPFTEANTNTTVAAVDIPAGSYVPPYGVTVYVTEAFTGGSPAITVGDGSDADGWADAADVTEGTPACYTSVDGAYSVAGKVYTADDTIDITFSASLTDGTCYLFVTYYDVEDVL